MTSDPSKPAAPSIETDAERCSEAQLETAIEKAEGELPKPAPAPDHANDGGII